MDDHDGAPLPTANDLILEAVHTATKLPAPAERQLVVTGDGDIVSGIEEGRAVVASPVVGVLPVGALRGAGSAACTVVAEIVAQSLAVGPISKEFKTVTCATACGDLKRVIVHHRLGLGKADLVDL